MMMGIGNNKPWPTPWVMAGDSPAHQAIPTQDDSYWAQVWQGIKRIPYTLLGPVGVVVEGMAQATGLDENTAPGTVAQFLADHPEFKLQIQQIYDQLSATLKAYLDTLLSVPKTANWFITYLPEIVIGTLVIAAIFAFKNPGVIKYAA